MLVFIVATLVSVLCLVIGFLYLHVPVTFATVAVSATSALIVGLLCGAPTTHGLRAVNCVRFSVRVDTPEDDSVLLRHAVQFGIRLTATGRNCYYGRSTAQRFTELRRALGSRVKFQNVVVFTV